MFVRALARIWYDFDSLPEARSAFATWEQARVAVERHTGQLQRHTALWLEEIERKPAPPSDGGGGGGVYGGGSVEAYARLLRQLKLL